MYDCNLLVPIATAVAVAIAYFALFKYIPAGQFSTTDIPNQAGRVILITGGNAGLGKTSTLELARKGAKVYMASRTESKAIAAIAEIKAVVPDADITFLPLDLTSFASIAAAAARFQELESAANGGTPARLHVLINNAGVMAEPYYETKDGYEIQFGTNHMGHFLLTKLLLPAVSLAAETADPGSVRIVNLSSIGHMASVNGINLKDIHAQLACGHTLQRYSLSKLANMQHARALAKRYPKIVCVSAHPGVVDTGLYVWFIGGYKVMSVAIWVMHRVFGTLPEMGALNQLCCAVGPSVGLEDSGEYFVPVGRAVNKVGWWWERGTWATRWGSNEKASDELWEWSEKEVENHGY